MKFSKVITLLNLLCEIAVEMTFENLERERQSERAREREERERERETDDVREEEDHPKFSKVLALLNFTM